MTPERYRKLVNKTAQAVAGITDNNRRSIAGLTPANQYDGKSSATLSETPFSLRGSGYNGLVELSADIQHRTQATVGVKTYSLYPLDSKWTLSSPWLNDDIATVFNSSDPVFLLESNGSLYVAGNVSTTSSIYRLDNGELVEESSGLVQSSFITSDSGDILSTDGSTVRSVLPSEATFATLASSGTSPAIEAAYNYIFVSALTGTSAVFSVIDIRGNVGQYTETQGGTFKGSAVTDTGAVFWFEDAGAWTFYYVGEGGVLSSRTISAALLATQNIGAGEEDSAIAIYPYQNDKFKVLYTNDVADASGGYSLRSQTLKFTTDWVWMGEEELAYYTSPIEANGSFSSPDQSKMGATLFLEIDGEIKTVDACYVPASILMYSSTSSGGGGDTPNLQEVTDAGSATTNNITVNGLTATTDPIDAMGDLRARSNLRFDSYVPLSGHNLLIVGTDGAVYSRDENYYTTQSWVTSQGYATQSWVNSQGFATQTWVNAQGFVDENLSSLSFNVADGVLTASLSGGTQTTVDLDGRYLQSVSLNDLTDVDAASNKNDGAVMQWSAVLNRFVLSNTLDLRIEGSDLLADNSPTAGQVYQYNGSTFQWATVTSGGVTSLNDIGDVSVPSPNTNDVLTWNGSTWVASAAGGGSADGVVNNALFSGGTLTLERSLGLSDVTVNLDGRYLQSYTETDPTGVASLAFSGTSTKTLTITLNDGSTRTATFTDLQGGGGSVADGVVNGASFNTSNGELTLNRTEGLSDVVVDLDGRYSRFTSFFVTADSNGGGETITNGDLLQLLGGAGISTARAGTSSTSIVTFNIEDDGVTTAKIAPEAVTTAKIAPEAVTTAKIDDEAVTEAKLDISNSPSTDQVLTYNGSQMEWADTFSGVGAGFDFYGESSIVSVSSTSWSPVTGFDSNYLSSSGGEVSESGDVFTTNTGGVYRITYDVYVGGGNTTTTYDIGLSLNGAAPLGHTTIQFLNPAVTQRHQRTKTCHLVVQAGDEIELVAKGTTATGLSFYKRQVTFTRIA